MNESSSLAGVADPPAEESLRAVAAAAGLRQLAGILSAAGREDLERLAEAIEDPALRQRWSGIDLTQYFPEGVIESQVSTGPPYLTRLFERLRVPSVFLPILWTWCGVFFAMRAYAGLLSTDAAAGAASFIALWQTGFGGRTRLTLGWIALGDAILIGIAVAVFVLSSYGYQAYERKREERISRLGARLRSALFRATEALRQDVVATPDDVRQAFTSAVQSLGSLGQAVGLTKELVRFLPKFESTTDRFAQASTGLQQTIGRLEAAGVSLAAGTTAMAQKNADLVNGLQTNLGELQHTTQALAMSANESSHLLQTLQASREALKEALDAGRLAAEGLRTVTSGTASQISAMNAAAVQVEAAAHAISEQLAATSREMNEAARLHYELLVKAQGAAQGFAVFTDALLDRAEARLASKGPGPRPHPGP